MNLTRFPYGIKDETTVDTHEVGSNLFLERG